VNKQKYMAELAGLLSFLNDEERSLVMAYYDRKFTEAGEAGESALIAELGTPMCLAIDLNRNGIDHILNEMKTPAEEEKAEAEPEAQPEIKEEKAVETEELIRAVMEPEEAEEPEYEPMPEEESRVTDKIESLPQPAEESEAQVEAKPESDDVFPELAAALGKNITVPEEPEVKTSVLGAIGFFILMIVPGIPLLAISIVLIPALLVPVVSLGYAGAVGVVASIKALSYIPDAMFVFGITLLIIAAAILVLLFCTWIIGGILRGWFKGVPSLWKRMARKERV